MALIKINSKKVIDACDKASIFWAEGSRKACTMPEPGNSFSVHDLNSGSSEWATARKASRIKDMAEYSVNHPPDIHIEANMVIIGEAMTYLSSDDYHLLKDYL